MLVKVGVKHLHPDLGHNYDTLLQMLHPYRYRVTDPTVKPAHKMTSQPGEAFAPRPRPQLLNSDPNASPLPLICSTYLSNFTFIQVVHDSEE